MGGIVLLLWYCMMFAVQFGPLIWLAIRWERQDSAALLANIELGLPPANVPVREQAIRWALAVLALGLPLFVTAPMTKATPALSIALGMG